MITPEAVETIRAHGAQFLGLVEDRSQPREVRLFASHVVGWALHFVRDERMVSEVLRALERAIHEDNEPELFLLNSLNTDIAYNPAVGAAVLRLGERACELGRDVALARITRALCFGDRANAEAPRVPPRWIARLVGTTAPEDATPPVLAAVSAWLGDERVDVEAARDVLVNPQAWVDLSIARF